MIRLENLTKSFRGRPALHGLTLDIPTGEIFGLLGHNGAGKSTAFGMILGQVHPDAGEAFVDGCSVQRRRSEALARVGAIFEAPGFYDYLSGWRNLELLAAYSARVKRSEISEAVATVGLTERIHDPVRAYSHGMRQRLALAQALLPAPAVVLLDEPTEGLDPEGIHEIRTLIRRLNRERGLTVLFSSHLLSEVEQLCDRIAILNQGRLVFHGKWTDLQGEHTRFRLDVDDWPHAEIVAAKVQARVLGDGTVEVQTGNDVADLVAALVWAGIKVRKVAPEQPTLEALYLRAVTSPSEAGPSPRAAGLSS